MARLLYILLAVVLFGILIAIHEFGHFFTAKLFHIKVNEFSIGMGPLLWQKTKGETQYSLRALPIGGFCALEGEDKDTGDPGAFARQAGWKKVIVLLAGAVMNFLLGLLIVLLVYTGVSSVRVPVVTGFADEFALSGEAGVMPGDVIKRIDGHGIWCYQDVQTYLSRNDGNGIDLELERGGKRVVLKDFPMYRQQYTHEGETYTGFGLIFDQVEPLNFWGRLRMGWIETLDYVRVVWLSLGDLVTGRVRVTEVSGVIGVVDVVSEIGVSSASIWLGIINVLNLMALIAVNLAVMNLLPIPALDGGRIFFILLNGVLWGIFRKNIPEKYEGVVHTAVFFLLIVFMILIAFHDIWNIFT